MATTSKRTRSGKANVWEFLLALSGNPTIVKWAIFVTASVVVCIAWIVGLQGRSFSVAGMHFDAQSTLPAPAATATNAPTAVIPPTALANLVAPSSTRTPTIALATMTTEVEPSQTPAAPRTKCPPPVAPLSRNAELITCAWGFWNDALYAEAIDVAEQCIDEFQGQALRDQRTQSTSGQPTPITGKPESKAERDAILAQGVLNDVAACHFVKGQSLERLGRSTEAQDAYRNVLQFSFARVWDAGGDPNGLGFFWSPAQAAADRLAAMP